MDLRPHSQTFRKRRSKTGAPEETGETGHPIDTAPPTQNPAAGVTTPRKTLPVVTVHCGDAGLRAQGCPEKGGDRRRRAHWRVRTPGAVGAGPAPLAARQTAPRCRPRPGAQTQDLITRRPVHHGQFQPVPTSPWPPSWDTWQRTLTISRLLEPPPRLRCLVRITAGTDAAAETPGPLSAGQTRTRAG